MQESSKIAKCGLTDSLWFNSSNFYLLFYSILWNSSIQSADVLKRVSVKFNYFLFSLMQNLQNFLLIQCPSSDRSILFRKHEKPMWLLPRNFLDLKAWLNYRYSPRLSANISDVTYTWWFAICAQMRRMVMYARMRDIFVCAEMNSPET